jgi:hypothetical protein
LTADPAVARSRLVTSRPVLVAILAVSAVLSLVSAVLFQAPELLGRDKVLTDFDAFYVAGMMAERGEAAEAYSAEKTMAAQEAASGTRSFMPWTYPPPYNLVVELLAQLPIGLAYLLFVAASFAFYLVVLRRIAGEYLPGVLIAILPTILLTVRTGQNGFLTGGLIGWFLIAFIKRRAIAGLPLGLMIIKPHLAVTISLMALFGKRWSAMAIAAGVVVAAIAAATAVYGWDIWTAFSGGARQAGEFLTAGYYPLFRMTSVYAAVRSSYAPAMLAFALQATSAIVALGLFLLLWRRGAEPRLLAAAACAASLFVSPYAYDYDMTVLGVGIAFALPHLLARARRAELAGLLLLTWFVTGYGIGFNTFLESELAGGSKIVTALGEEFWISLAAPGLIALVAGAVAVLRRPAPAQLPSADDELAVMSRR